MQSRRRFESLLIRVPCKILLLTSFAPIMNESQLDSICALCLMDFCAVFLPLGGARLLRVGVAAASGAFFLIPVGSCARIHCESDKRRYNCLCGSTEPRARSLRQSHMQPNTDGEAQSHSHFHNEFIAPEQSVTLPQTFRHKSYGPTTSITTHEVRQSLLLCRCAWRAFEHCEVRIMQTRSWDLIVK